MIRGLFLFTSLVFLATFLPLPKAFAQTCFAPCKEGPAWNNEYLRCCARGLTDEADLVRVFCVGDPAGNCIDMWTLADGACGLGAYAHSDCWRVAECTPGDKDASRC